MSDNKTIREMMNLTKQLLKESRPSDKSIATMQRSGKDSGDQMLAFMKTQKDWKHVSKTWAKPKNNQIMFQLKSNPNLWLTLTIDNGYFEAGLLGTDSISKSGKPMGWGYGLIQLKRLIKQLNNVEEHNEL